MNKKILVYERKEEDINKFADAGFDVITSTPFSNGFFIYKEVKIPIDDRLVRAYVNYYNHPKVQEHLRKSNLDDYLHSIGINYYKKDGNLVLDEDNETFKQNITTVRFGTCWSDPDRFFGLYPFDLTCPIQIWAAKLYRPYVKDLLDELTHSGLIGQKFVEENA